jgi:uncharacterized protein RhaS with RHS repeats
MYNPTIGRWMSEDPIGFEGGDTNLSRYVGNHPTYSTDPTGLEPPSTTQKPPALIGTPPTSTGNNSKAFLPWLNSQIFIPKRKSLISGLKCPDIEPDLIKPGKTGTQAGTGDVWDKSKMPAGTVAGSDGALTCIGVIVYEPKDDGRIVVFHFNATDSPTATIGNLFTWKFQKDSPAYVFGGDDEPSSRATLAATIQALKAVNLKVYYIPYDGLWIDKDGKLYISDVATKCD